MLQENISNLSSYRRRLERLAGILKFQELLKLHPFPVKVVMNENGFHITDCVWSTENCTEGPDTCECCFLFIEPEKGYKSLTAFRCHSFSLSVSSRVIMWFKIFLPHQHYPLAAMVGKDGKLYFRLVDNGALLGGSKVYEFAKRFDKPRHSRQRCVAGPQTVSHHDAKVKLVTPDVVFNILNAELSSLATSFAISLNAGSALVENSSNLFVESYKTSPVLQVQDSPVPNSILVRLWVQTFIQKVQDMRRMQNGSKPSIQMVYEACLRAERLSLPERPAQRPEKMPTPPAEPERPS
ncbi:uncharacterized protein TNCV_2176061 [Trichonephila clavipes]|uniref:Uncharacterized protein n=1 Tax=Trichonephila clavipes TaxID=2585209 RepID=A0A8X6S5E1_TRICX|nr:uncharacterized protein TNCV_2176061 [Trichonephila clavipes]